MRPRPFLPRWGGTPSLFCVPVGCRSSLEGLRQRVGARSPHDRWAHSIQGCKGVAVYNFHSAPPFSVEGPSPLPFRRSIVVMARPAYHTLSPAQNLSGRGVYFTFIGAACRDRGPEGSSPCPWLILSVTGAASSAPTAASNGPTPTIVKYTFVKYTLPGFWLGVSAGAGCRVHPKLSQPGRAAPR